MPTNDIFLTFQSSIFDSGLSRLRHHFINRINELLLARYEGLLQGLCKGDRAKRRGHSQDRCIQVIKQFLSNPRGDLGPEAAADGLCETGGRPILIASQEAHYSFAKAANLLGLGRRGLRSVAVPPGGRLAGADVERAIEEAEEKAERMKAEG